MREDRGIGDIAAMISIADAYPFTASAPYGTAKIPRVLRLIFDDTTQEDYRYYPPNIKDVRRIINFAESMQNHDGTMLIHCEAGISRSAAAAVICKTVWMGPGKEIDAIFSTYANNRRAWPNTLMIRYADELLNRNGALVAAVNANPDAEVWTAQRNKEVHTVIKEE